MQSPTLPPEATPYSTFCCPNLDCSLRGQRAAGNIVHRSWTGKAKEIERLRCTECGQEVSERRGTLRQGSKLPEETVERWLKCQRWGVCDTGRADLCGVEIKTVHHCHPVATRRAPEQHEQGTRDLKVEGVQLEERHSKRRGPQVEWLHTAIARSRRFMLWVPWGPSTHESAALLSAPVVARLCGLPVWLSEGWKAYPAALLQVLGRVYRRRRQGRRGRHPNPRLVPPTDLFYGQVVKVREVKGKLVRVERRGIYGGPRRFFTEMARRRLGATLHTAFRARGYGPRRGLGAPLRRRTRCTSLSPSRPRARVWLLVDLYNFVLPHKSLRQKGRARTPAMAQEVAEHVWSYRDYLWYPVHPDPVGRQLMQQRVKELLTPALEAA